MSERLIHTTVEPPTMRRSRRGISGQKPPLKVEEIWAIRIRLQLEERTRDLDVHLAIDNKLRACDLTALKVDDVAMSGRVKSRPGLDPARVLLRFEAKTAQPIPAVHDGANITVR
jgi:hypothetical protein